MNPSMGPPGPPGHPLGVPWSPAPISANVIREAPWEWLVQGYQGAYKRFLEASQRRDEPEGMYVALFEALTWAGVLEERSRPHDERLLWAIRYVRDRMTHSWADALEGREVPTATVMRAAGGSRFVMPPTVWDWFWRDVGELPPVPASHRSTARNEQKSFYIELLAGKPARAALEELHRIFAAT